MADKHVWFYIILYIMSLFWNPVANFHVCSHAAMDMVYVYAYGKHSLCRGTTMAQIHDEDIVCGENYCLGHPYVKKCSRGSVIGRKYKFQNSKYTVGEDYMLGFCTSDAGELYTMTQVKKDEWKLTYNGTLLHPIPIPECC